MRLRERDLEIAKENEIQTEGRRKKIREMILIERDV